MQSQTSKWSEVIDSLLNPWDSCTNESIYAYKHIAGGEMVLVNVLCGYLKLYLILSDQATHEN